MAGVHVPNNLRRKKNYWTHKALNSEWVMWPNKQLTAYHIQKTKPSGANRFCAVQCASTPNIIEKRKKHKSFTINKT